MIPDEVPERLLTDKSVRDPSARGILAKTPGTIHECKWNRRGPNQATILSRNSE